jgi:hypothetical protein
MSEFFDTVLHTWAKEVPNNQNPMGVLHIKLSRTAKALKKWSKALIPHNKLTMWVYKEVIYQLEKVQEIRILTTPEHNLIKLLKARILGLAVIQRCIARQRSRITWLRHGDANTKKFHIMANQRRKKNFIHSLHSEEGIAVTQPDKHRVILNHFNNHLGSYAPRNCTLNLNSLDSRVAK